ncbi:DUF2254 domain-containing protein [Loktanella sp. SALINAS62]|uniref:DUF2254 domain-containing protein n=1 Tax=Loktanella sp. SALINAS62 TaxID=2706124 RepID=UPI001B8D26AB|nr:DUF2254 domain-containing protein [Loktanella sp. SALINAS62]MBS1302229.1 DUF2254 domain-containing protein [Loktanella sp. SALINAS62]
MAMMGGAFMRKIVVDVRASYWAVPSGFVVAAMMLAQLFIWLDRNPDVLPFTLPDTWIDRQGDGARQTLTTIATAVIGVAGVMFSMTLVAVSFAAGNFGPRLIGNFMRDRGTQISFGLLMATFVYAVFVLRAIHGPTDDVAPFVPQMSLLLAMGLMVVSVFTMIFYVHHVPETINVSNIASDLGHRFSLDIRQLIDARGSILVEDLPFQQRSLTTDIYAAHPGYIQQMDRDTLFDCARRQDWLIKVHHNPGTFISPHVPLMTVHSNGVLTETQIGTLRDAIATGNARTEDQATPYIGDQLCEMVARALSPGFNDPFTAMNCLNWLHAGLMEAIHYKGGLKPLTTQRVTIRFTDFGDLLTPFENCAAYTVTDRMARTRHLMLARSLVNDAGRDHPQTERLERLVRQLDQPD